MVNNGENERKRGRYEFWNNYVDMLAFALSSWESDLKNENKSSINKELEKKYLEWNVSLYFCVQRLAEGFLHVNMK